MAKKIEIHHSFTGTTEDCWFTTAEVRDEVHTFLYEHSPWAEVEAKLKELKKEFKQCLNITKQLNHSEPAPLV